MRQIPRGTGRLLYEILEVQRQLQDLSLAQIRMEERMTQEFDNMKAAVAEAVSTMLAAIDRIRNTDNPVEIQAEADKLNAAVADLKSALG